MVIEAIVGHLVGDYLAQNDWMAQNKKTRTWPCIVHCSIWTLCVTAFAGWWAYPWAIGVLFATHFVQDRTRIVNWYMNLIGQRAFAGPPLGPWSIIVVDNVWHIVAIYFVSMAAT